MSIEPGHGQGEPPITKSNVVVALTFIVSSVFATLFPSSSGIVIVTLVVLLFRTPGEQHTLFIMSVLFAGVVGHGLLLHCWLAGIATLGVTTAILAPCLTAFLREFLVYQALANSDIPNKISNNNVSIKAVSINVCPFCFLNIFIFVCVIKVRPSKGPDKKSVKMVSFRNLIMGYLKRY